MNTPDQASQAEQLSTKKDVRIKAAMAIGGVAAGVTALIGANALDNGDKKPVVTTPVEAPAPTDTQESLTTPTTETTVIVDTTEPTTTTENRQAPETTVETIQGDGGHPIIVEDRG